MQIRYDKNRFRNFCAKASCILIIGAFIAPSSAFACCCTDWINSKVKTVDDEAKKLIPKETDKIKATVAVYKNINTMIQTKMLNGKRGGSLGNLENTTMSNYLHGAEETNYLLKTLIRLETVLRQSEISTTKALINSNIIESTKK